MSNVEHETLDLSEIEDRLNSLEKDRLALEKALDQKRIQSKKELASEIIELIASRGYDIAEIIDIISLKPSSPRKRKRARQYSKYVDPNDPNNVYVRGVLPRWMKAQMQKRGFDPKISKDREEYKQKHLKREAIDPGTDDPGPSIKIKKY